MPSMPPLAETTAFVFGLVALGYLSGWTGFLKVEVGDALTQFAVGIALPLLLFRTMVNADFAGAAPWALWAVYFFSVAVAWVAGHLTVTRAFAREPKAGVVGGVSAAFSNMVLLGIPLILGVFGQPGFEVLSLLVAVHLPVMMVVSIAMFELAGRGRGDRAGILSVAGDFLAKLFLNPLLIGILAGLLWRLTGMPLPALAVRFVDALAGVAGPVALFAMGLALRKFGLSGNIRPSLAVAALKLLLMPAVALAGAVLLGLPPLTAKVAVAAAALPAGVNPYLIASRFGTGQALASNAMTVSTALGALSVAFWLLVAEAVFG